MRGGFRIGRLFGINIIVDWSWLFIFFLVTWNLAAAFGQLHQNWNPTLSWGLAIASALLFFGSVLAHELAHSLVAKAQGVPVRNITLFLFGGVSNIQRHPDSPRDEFVMAILGPATSIAIGGVLLWIAAALIGLEAVTTDLTQVLARLDPLPTLLLWLGSVNVMLGIFNMIPGFPLDGGRVLRSILWAGMGNLRRATRWAAEVGQLISWLMIFAGIAMIFGVQIPFFGTGLISGLWLAFIGWFLGSAAVQSYQQVVVQDILEGVPIARMMRANPPTVAPRISISHLIYEHVMGTDDHSFPVLEGDRLVGIVTLDDVRRVRRDAWDTTAVADIMTPTERLVAVTPTDDAAEALSKLSQRDVNQLPVLRDGVLVGLLRRRDIIRWLQLESNFEVG
jgi:Zn-dependent protease